MVWVTGLEPALILYRIIGLLMIDVLRNETKHTPLYELYYIFFTQQYIFEIPLINLMIAVCQLNGEV
jgi:hypothetical protein